MMTLVDRIRLKSADCREPFLHWVREVDYRACAHLDSIERFRVFACLDGDGLDFFEVIEVSSLDAFRADMDTPIFQSLVRSFNDLAQVKEQFGGEMIAPGYLRAT